jgi:hypothetical protein
MNQFQIAAISSGLKRPPLVSLLPELRRLCRYDRPPGAEYDPISFGWLDLRGHRVAFLRVPVAGIAGRSGSFAAHLLVGPQGSMAEGEIASSFGAGFWWTGLTERELEEIAGGKQDFELPLLDWDEALETRVEPDAEAEGPASVLARDLLSAAAGERLAVLDDQAAFGPALGLLGQRFPQAFDGISLSTWEIAPTFPLTVVGTPVRPSGMEVCDLLGDEGLDPADRATARQLLADEPAADLLRAAVRQLTELGLGGERGSRWEAAGTLVAMAGGAGEELGPVAALANPDVVAYLAVSESGRERLVELATGGAPQLLGALKQARERIPPAQLADLCRAFGRRFEASGELRGCAAALAIFPPGKARERLEEELLTIALRPGPAPGTIADEDAVALLRIATGRRLKVQRCRPLLQLTAPHLGACAENPVVSDEMLVAMLGIALASQGDPGGISRALRAHPRLLGLAKLDRDEEGRWLALAQRLQTRQLEDALPALLLGLTRQSQQELTALMQRVPGPAARQALLTAGHLFDGAAPRVFAELCEIGATAALAGGELEPARRLLAHGKTSDSRLASHLLVRGPASTSERVQAARRASDLQDPALRSAVFEATADAALRELRHPEDAGLVWSLLASSYPQEEDEEILERLLERAVRTPPGSGQGALLAWLGATLLTQRPQLRKRNGQPKSRRAAELSAVLAQRMSASEAELMTPFAEAEDRRAARWWKSLTADRSGV